MLKPICVKCQRFYRAHKTGRWFVEAMPIGGAGVTPPGTAAPALWKPYKVWIGDEWQCHGCGHLIIVGTGSQPVREAYQDDFDKACQEASYLQVNDC